MLARQQGVSAWDAAMQAARPRFRPIVMTSLAFILGVVPLAIATGAGAASRHSIGHRRHAGRHRTGNPLRAAVPLCRCSTA